MQSYGQEKDLFSQEGHLKDFNLNLKCFQFPASLIFYSLTREPQEF